MESKGWVMFNGDMTNDPRWRIEKWVVESSTHDEATKQPGHVGVSENVVYPIVPNG